MARYGMLIDLVRCAGCDTCGVACEMAHGSERGAARIRFDTVEWESPESTCGRAIVPHECMHCEDPACEAACPTGAIVRDGNNVLATNEQACTGCGLCVRACPYEARSIAHASSFAYPSGPAPFETPRDASVAIACDLCAKRREDGLDPACVVNCPGHARIFGDLDDPESPISMRIARGDAIRIDDTGSYYVPAPGMPRDLLPTSRFFADAKDGKLPRSVAPVLDRPLASSHSKEATNGLTSSATVETRYTTCDMCNQNPFCGIEAHVRDGKVVSVTSRADHPKSPLCAKGLAGVEELYNPDRLTHPLRRTNPKGEPSSWERISWDEALDEVASQFQRVKAAHGAESVLFYCGDPKEPRGALVRVAALFGSPTIGFESSLCATAAQMAMRLVYGTNRPGFGANPTPKTKSCIVWSLNAAWSQPSRHEKLVAAKERGCRFVVVDPRVTPTVTSLADVHLQLRPGTDGALALGFINLLIEENLYDRAFVEEWTHGFDGLRELARGYTPEVVEDITGVPAEKLRAAVHLVAENAPSTLISSSAGITHATNAGNAQRAVFMIPALLGMVDEEGGFRFGPSPLPVAGNAMGKGTSAAFRMESAFRSDDFKSRRPDRDDFPAWNALNLHVQMARFPEYVEEGRIRAALLVGANAMIWPQTHVYQNAIAKLEFCAAVDYFERPWTHDFVDILLPAAMSFERKAPFAVYGRTVYGRDLVVEPQGEAREDWEIIFDLGARLGFAEECFMGSVDAALDELMHEAGSSLEDLREHREDGLKFRGGKNPARKYVTGEFNGKGTPGFATPSGKVEFDSEILKSCGLEGLPVYREPARSPRTAKGADAHYPLVLCTGSRVPTYTHSKLRDIPILSQYMPEPVVRLHPDDAAARGIETGDAVRMFNQFGSVTMKAEVTRMVLPGVVDAFHGWSCANVNELIPREFDPITGFPAFRSALCEIEKA